MKNVKVISMIVALGAAFASFSAKADMVTDAHGNVGYDTAAECDAAVASGTARFYTPFTNKAPLKRKGEAKVQTASLKDLGEQYARGACDVGVGRRMGREGVSTALQGKFIPFSPDMPVNVYTDKAGNAVRVTMAQCDNWFSGSAPRPVAVVPTASAPVTQPSEPVVDVTPAVVPAAAAAFAAKPYVFGTIGALDMETDAVYGSTSPRSVSGIPVSAKGVAKDNRDTRFAGQVGFGVQFNKLLGAELFYTGSANHKLDMTVIPEVPSTVTLPTGVTVDNQKYTTKTEQHIYGTRLTLGHNFTDAFRVFAKGGVAGTTTKIKEVSGGDGGAIASAMTPILQNWLEGKKGTYARGTAGLGATYNVTDKLAIRGDYDHFFKKKYKGFTNKGQNYVGVGVQYNFR
ncbi:outer membrane protein [Alysiella crassa]|uniref:Outer membrane protein beta-barrel domain-containing protein n=1 Tax=Alysiella crassa TaxID=153491 RepID=A0A376BWI9_9NEIS|nr:outer membrane beta-barrel protein [Alysiella crassa]UOP06619.1 porin family protein [Alysiella crassa]SSY81163.1 Uncharacterised protein [Alysiella crassa]